MNTESVPLKQALLGLIPNLRAFAVSLCGDVERADDLVQETLLKAWDHLESFEQGTNLRAWLFTILRNTYFSDCRRRRREVADPDGSKAADLAVHPGQQGHLDMQDFRRALNVLPPDQREALVLIGAAGFSYEEAASISGCAVGTIKSRVNRARARLTELLGVTTPREFGPDAATEAIVARTVSIGSRQS
jgi:RNA polymerase sigma-70 factor (ECF subfamily)